MSELELLLELNKEIWKDYVALYKNDFSIIEFRKIDHTQPIEDEYSEQLVGIKTD